MGRRAPTIKIREEDRATLERWSKSKTVSAYQHERAIMILESAAGVAVNEIAKQWNTYPNKVIVWRNRYQKDGLS
ncbi:MAG: helix-turn-helix domain-containing protein, partial [Bacteroidota bacterium]